MSTRWIIGVLSFLCVAGCSHTSTPHHIDAGEPVDLGNYDMGCFNRYYPCPGPDTRETIQQTELGLAVATSLVLPLIPDGNLLDADPMPNVTAVSRAEHGFAGGVVVPADCATFAWTDLNAFVVLSGCTLSATGLPVTGTVRLALATAPATFHVAFTDLVVGTTHFDGQAVIVPRDAALDLDIAYLGTRLTATHMFVNQWSEPPAGTQRGVAGRVVRTVSGVSTDVQASDNTFAFGTGLAWAPGDCLPSTGALTTGTPPTTIMFIGATPYDGRVGVVVGETEEGPTEFFSPCPH